MTETTETGLPCDECKSSDAVAKYDDGHTYCFSCGHYGHGDNMTQEKKEKKSRPLIEEGQVAKWESRGLSEHNLTKCGVFRSTAYNPNTKQQEACRVFPYHDASGTVIGQKVRFKDKTFISHGTVSSDNPMFCQHLCRARDTKTLVITEGEIDCLTVREILSRMDVVSIANGAQSVEKQLSSNLQFIEKYKHIVLCFDMDEEGRKAVDKALAILPVEKVQISQSQYKDANEALLKGGVDDLKTMVLNSSEYIPDNVVNGSELWETLDKEPIESYSYPYPELNTLTYGLRKSELSMIGGVSGGGKSTISADIAYHLVKEHNMKVGYIALEDEMRESAERFISREMGERVHLKDMRDNPKYKEAFDNILGGGQIEFVDGFGTMDAKKMISTMRYLVKAKGVDFIILDHITMLTASLDIKEEGTQAAAISKMMTDFRTFISETGCGVIMLSHINRTDGLNMKFGGEDEGRQPRYLSVDEGGIPIAQSFKGSASLVELSNTVITFGRDVLHGSDEVQMYIIKCRYTGNTGAADKMFYNKDTGLFEPIVNGDVFQEDSF